MSTVYFYVELHSLIPTSATEEGAIAVKMEVTCVISCGGTDHRGVPRRVMNLVTSLSGAGIAMAWELRRQTVHSIGAPPLFELQ
jgi:predicted metal-binding protein